MSPLSYVRVALARQKVRLTRAILAHRVAVRHPTLRTDPTAIWDYPYDQIAAIVATSEQNARQLVARARRHVEQRRPRFEPSREQRERLARRFFATAQDGDLGALEELLAHDVTVHGGGLPQPLKGRVRVARTLLAGVRTATTRFGGVSLREVTVNGQPGAMVLDPSERLIGVVALDIAEGGQIQTVTSVINPDKLRHLGQREAASDLGGPPQVLGLLLDQCRRQAERQGFFAGRLQRVAGRTRIEIGWSNTRAATPIVRRLPWRSARITSASVATCNGSPGL